MGEIFKVKNFPNNDIIGRLFSNRKDFRLSVMAALDQYMKGGYEPGTPTFTKMIIGSISKMKPEEYGIIQKEIQKEIVLIKKEKEEQKIHFNSISSESIVTDAMREDAKFKRLRSIKEYDPNASDEDIEKLTEDGLI